jgi:hypothetical protein
VDLITCTFVGWVERKRNPTKLRCVGFHDVSPNLPEVRFIKFSFLSSATLKEQIKNISASGEVAPKGCHLARYQARGQYKAYWYYKLQASEPIFVSKKEQGKPSRYKHLGSAGTQAHVDAVMMVLRRVQIQ